MKLMGVVATAASLPIVFLGCSSDNWIHPDAAEAIKRQQSSYKPVVIPPTSGRQVRFGPSAPNESFIIAADGTFLGRFTNEFDSDSIANEFGDHGSEFSRTSMFNEFSDYGSEFGRFSAMNPHASEPPRLFIGEAFSAWVTVNDSKMPRVNPYALRASAKSQR